MDENRSPQDILNEIFEKSGEPTPPPQRPTFEYPSEDDPLPPSSSGGSGDKSREAGGTAQKLLPWLCLMLGAALLVMAVCILRVSKLSGQLDLLDDIQRLEQENGSLEAQKNVLSDHLAQVKEEREALRHQNDQHYYELAGELTDIRGRSSMNNVLDHLERFVDTRDWLMAGIIVERYDWYFLDSSNFVFGVDALPSQTARYLELRKKVLEQDIMILEQIPVTDGVPDPAEETREYFEEPKLQDLLYAEEDCQTAIQLAAILSYYPTIPGYAASYFISSFPDSGSLERLNSGAFQPSTLELLEQVKADLSAGGYLAEEADGTFRAISRPLDTIYG